jgi:hypothetical protein
MTKSEYYNRAAQIFDEALQILKDKSHDYCGETNPFRNFELGSHVSGIDIPHTILVRLGDKLSRIGTLLNTKDVKVKDEKLADTIKDAINYLTILLMYLEVTNYEDE